MVTNTPFQNVTGIHCTQVIFTVRTHTKDDEGVKLLQPGSLVFATVERFMVKAVSINDANTALKIVGVHVREDGKPVHEGENAAKGIEEIEIPLDQTKIAMGPNVWAGDAAVAEAYAKDFNTSMRNATMRAIKKLEELSQFCELLNEKLG